MSARTPGPWRAIETDAAQGTVTWRIVADTEFGNLQGVALVTWWERANTGQRSPETDANAAFIVEACNAHDSLRAENARLREALANLVGACSRIEAGMRGGEVMGRVSHYTEQARAALGKAVK